MKKIMFIGLVLILTFVFITSCSSGSIVGTVWETREYGEYWSILFTTESECVFNDDGFNEKGTYTKKGNTVTMDFNVDGIMIGKIDGTKMTVEIQIEDIFVVFIKK